MFSSISGRSVLVTGGTKGIGKGIAAGFAAEGARVVITGRDAEAGQRTAAELTAAGRGGHVRGRRRQRPGQLRGRGGGRPGSGMAASTWSAATRASSRPPRWSEMTPGQLDEVLSVNLKGTFFIVQAALPALRESGHGRVIVTSSITGPLTGFTGWSHYGASKAGQLGFIRSAALELARSGITVNAVLPGNIVTEGLGDLGADYLASMEAAIPLGHLGSVADIASAALFFASDEAGYITGQTLVVDGGQTIPESLEAMG